MLRGINLGPSRRIAMADLRELLAGAGYTDVKTYVQSGNIVLGSELSPAQLREALAQQIEQRFAFAVPVTVRTAPELRAVCERDPIAGAADDPRRYQVTFLAAEPEPSVIEQLRSAARDSERLAVHGHEIYTYHPDGIAGSKLSTAVVGRALGETATARNWTTVNKLLELASAR